jgi:hypothetical protein
MYKKPFLIRLYNGSLLRGGAVTGLIFHLGQRDGAAEVQRYPEPPACLPRRALRRVTPYPSPGTAAPGGPAASKREGACTHFEQRGDQRVSLVACDHVPLPHVPHREATGRVAELPHTLRGGRAGADRSCRRRRAGLAVAPPGFASLQRWRCVAVRLTWRCCRSRSTRVSPSGREMRSQVAPRRSWEGSEGTPWPAGPR